MIIFRMINSRIYIFECPSSKNWPISKFFQFYKLLLT